jgi:alpha-glucosidase
LQVNIITRKKGKVEVIHEDINLSFTDDKTATLPILEELARYGKAKNVGLILWITFRGIQDDFGDDSFNLFEHFSGMDIKGFKIDFMDRNDQDIVV